MIKTLNLNVSGIKCDVAPKLRPDRFPSIGDHIQVNSTSEHTWVTPRHTVIEGSSESKECYRCIIFDFELVTRSVTFVFQL